MQLGDVTSTYADIEEIKELTGFAKLISMLVLENLYHGIKCIFRFNESNI